MFFSTSTAIMDKWNLKMLKNSENKKVTPDFLWKYLETILLSIYVMGNFTVTFQKEKFSKTFPSPSFLVNFQELLTVIFVWVWGFEHLASKKAGGARIFGTLPKSLYWEVMRVSIPYITFPASG